MILSMTGYASRTLQLESQIIQLEIRSVNHRFLDLTLKLSEEVKHLESNFRSLIAENVSRGKVDVKIYIKDNKSTSVQINLNQPLLREYLKLSEELQKLCTQNISISMHDILNFPGIVNQEASFSEEMKLVLFNELDKLLADFRESQASEGKKITQLLTERSSEIFNVIKSLKPLVENATLEYKAKLTERLKDFLKESDVNDTRLQQEFAFFCQKIDVSEEIDRLHAHTTELSDLLTKGGSIGKRLDFICQEMNREANTFGAKSVSIPTSKCAVELKVLIEQIREQVQNIM